MEPLGPLVVHVVLWVALPELVTKIGQGVADLRLVKELWKLVQVQDVKSKVHKPSPLVGRRDLLQMVVALVVLAVVFAVVAGVLARVP